MELTEKVELCQELINDVSVTATQIEAYLNVALQRIADRLFPFGGTTNNVPARYDYLQCELAVRMIARRGGEGEIAHSENGISRTYGNTDDIDLLERVVPMVGVL